MNKRNNWQAALDFANTDLKPHNVSLTVKPDSENTYSLNIVIPDGEEEYACGYYEEELEGLVEDAFDWAKTQCVNNLCHVDNKI